MWHAGHWIVLLLAAFVQRAAALSEQLETIDTHTQWRDLVRRNHEAEDRLTWRQPRAVRKMSDDPGEKFWPHFWQFDIELPTNDSIVATQPLALHLESQSGWLRPFAHAMFRRDGTCPSGNSPCTSINQPNSCCPNGNQCINVQDTGNGPVGCCPAGETCGTTIPGCNTAQGYTSCPNSDNKGCCIPGYTCSGSICINVGTQVVTAPTSSTSTSSPSSSSTSTALSVITIVSVNTSGFTTTATVTATVTISPSTSSSSASAAAPVRPITSSSDAAIAPASVSASTSTTTITSTSTATGFCPTGYYMCSAVYLGGCCQVDRDCNTTTCPPTASTTIVDGSPTVVIPASATGAQCAAGWYSCPASLGGSCCPTGFGCAQTDCPASVAGVAAQSKQAPSEATVSACVWSFLVLSLAVATSMIIL